MFDSGTSVDSTDTLAQVRALCGSLDPAGLPGPSVPVVFDSLVAMRRLIDGAITRLSPRYERSGVWQDRGARSAADAIASSTGTSPADSRRRLETGKRLADKAGLDDAVREGSISSEQAQIIAGAAESAEADARLIEVARSRSHKELREESARERARQDHSDEARQSRQQRLRRCSRWTDADGMYNLLLRTLPEIGAEIDACLAPLVDDVFAAARKEGRREDVQAYAADAVASVLVGRSDGPSSAGGSRGGSAVRPEKKVIAFVDIEALQRGHTVGEETCELAGVGPVSVAAVRAMFGEAAVAAVFRDAVDIRSVVHLGRQVTAAQRTALEARGARCSVVDCRSTHQLEIDHGIGWTFTRVTSLDDLDWLCSTDHAIKTQRNLLAIGPPGARRLVERDPTDPTKPKLPLVQVRPALDRDGPEQQAFGLAT